MNVKAQWEFTIYGYCLMYNHIHLLVQVASLDILAGGMQMIGQDYARWHNFKYERTGHLFDNRYRSHPLEDYQQLIATLQYIHHNPLSARLVSDCDDYRWSSQRSYLESYTKSCMLIDTNWIHTFYPTKKHYYQYMSFNFDEKPCANSAIRPRALDAQLPPSDALYFNNARDLIQQLIKNAQEQAPFHYSQIERSRIRRFTTRTLERNWIICRLLEAFPTSARQLGRVLGYSHNIVMRAIRFEQLYLNESCHGGRVPVPKSLDTKTTDIT